MKCISSTCPVICNAGISTSLSEIDIAFRYKVDRPMRIKWVKDIATMIVDIYMVGPLTYPKVFQCDNGSKFKAEVREDVGEAWSKDMAYNDKV